MCHISGVVIGVLVRVVAVVGEGVGVGVTAEIFFAAIVSEYRCYCVVWWSVQQEYCIQPMLVLHFVDSIKETLETIK